MSYKTQVLKSMTTKLNNVFKALTSVNFKVFLSIKLFLRITPSAFHKSELKMFIKSSLVPLTFKDQFLSAITNLNLRRKI